MQASPAELFKVLSVASRIRIIELLKERGPTGVNELAEEIGISPSAVSQHLKVLRYAGLVRGERKGYFLPYDVEPDALAHCQALLTQVCTCGCQGTCRVQTGEIERCGDEMALLEKYERELRQELKKVKARIAEIKAGE